MEALQTIQKGFCLDSVLPIMEHLNSGQATERTLHEIVDSMVRQLDVRTVAVVEINPETEFLEIHNFYGLSWEFCKSYRKPIASDILRSLIWKGNPIYIPDAATMPELAAEIRLEKEAASIITLPLVSGHQPIGFLYGDSAEINHFDDHMQKLFALYANLAGLTISRKRITDQNLRLNSRDADSGALRFDHFFPRLQEMYHRARRLNESFSLLLVDIEKFGSIVQQYGMEMARQVLREVADLLENNLRVYDGFCRFGADEFLVGLPATGENTAMDAARKILRVIQNSVFTSQTIEVNVLIGVAAYPTHAASLNGLITATKNGLLSAKRGNFDERIGKTAEMFD